ncbi:MAG TPA: hypothetical protein VF906_05765, partial [Candidatus Bathyarchaeia archaeon]
TPPHRRENRPHQFAKDPGAGSTSKGQHRLAHCSSRFILLGPFSNHIILGHPSPERVVLVV